MDGALLAVGTVADTLKHKSPYKEQVEAMMLTYVAPCFESPYGHLRAKACWVAKEFCDFEFSGGGGEAGRGPQFAALLEAVMRRLSDPDLPVRVEGVVALRSFVDALADLDVLSPVLPSLLDAVFNLMAEIDNEDLVFTLEAIVEKFGDAIAPHAAGLATSLAAAFWRYVQANEGDEDEDDNDAAAMAAFGCIRALNALLDAVAALPGLLPGLLDTLAPIMEEMMSPRGQDLFEEVLEMASYFTYFVPTPLPPRLWGLWPRISAALMDWGIDYWDNALPALDNLVSRDTATFLGSANPDYQASMFQLVSHALSGDFSDTDIVAVPKLMEVVLAASPAGSVDRWVEPFIGLAWSRLQRTTRRPLKDELIALVSVALHYNSTLALGALHRLGATNQLLGGWSELINARRCNGRKPAHFQQQRLKKLCALGLVALLRAADDALQPPLVAGLPQVLHGTLAVLSDLKKQQEEAAEQLQAGSGSEEEEDQDDDADSDAPFEVEDDQYLKKLQRAARDILGGGDGGDDDDDDDDGEDDWSDEEEACSNPFEELDPYANVLEALATMRAAMPARYDAVVTRADSNVHATLQGLQQHVEAESRKQQQQQQQEKS
jgi:hypothetical protein